MPQLTGSQIRYLHVIYKAQSSPAGIRSVDISRELQVTKASVSRMVKLLSDMGLILVVDRGAIDLTPEGEIEGHSIHCKVTGLYRFFTDYLELDGPEAIESAYSFISGFSEHCVDRLLGKGWPTGQTRIKMI